MQNEEIKRNQLLIYKAFSTINNVNCLICFQCEEEFSAFYFYYSGVFSSSTQRVMHSLSSREQVVIHSKYVSMASLLVDSLWLNMRVFFLGLIVIDYL